MKIKEKVLKEIRENHRKFIVKKSLKDEKYDYCKKCEDGIIEFSDEKNSDIDIHIEPYIDVVEAIDLTLAEVGKVIDKNIKEVQKLNQGFSWDSMRPHVKKKMQELKQKLGIERR